MSLEQSIENLIKAVQENTDASKTLALVYTGKQIAAEQTKGGGEKPPKQTRATKPKEEKKEESAGETITLQQIKDGFTEIQLAKGPKEGRQACIDILSRLGVTGSKDIDPKQYGAAMELINATLGGEDPGAAKKEDDGFDI